MFNYSTNRYHRKGTDKIKGTNKRICNEASCVESHELIGDK